MANTRVGDDHSDIICVFYMYIIGFYGNQYYVHIQVVILCCRWV